MEDSFIGNALNAIDGKNRLSVPSSFRDAIAAKAGPRAIILAPAERADCLVGYDPGYTARALDELETRFAGDYSDARDDRFRETFGLAEKFAIDDNGRIIISSTMKENGELDRLALFVGLGRHFEVWNPHRFLARPGLGPRTIRNIQSLLDARGTA